MDGARDSIHHNQEDKMEELQMNGLRYIRTRCNLSLSELAEFIGVTRQALYYETNLVFIFQER